MNHENSVRRRGMKRIGIFITLILMFLNSQVFSFTASNPMGIKGVQEVLYAVLCVWAFASVTHQLIKKGSVRYMDLVVIMLVLILSLYGAVMANLKFGQPLVYGMMEERRIFSIWIYFPLTTALRQNWVSLQQLEFFLIGIAIFCALLMVGVFIGLLPAINNLDISELTLRGVRYGIGQFFVAVAILLLFTKHVHIPSRYSMSLILFLSAVLLVIVQTRQIILGLMVGLIYMLRGGKAAVSFALLVLAVLIVPLVFPNVSELFERYIELVIEATSNEYLTQSWRGLSIAVVLESLLSGEIYGHGSLSPLWNDGFGQIYGPFFYLADIGVFGTFYRYGLLGIMIYIFYLFTQIKLLRRIPERRARIVYFSIFIMLVVTAPVGAPLEYRGFIAGFILAVTHFLSLNAMTSQRILRNKRGSYSYVC